MNNKRILKNTILNPLNVNLIDNSDKSICLTKYHFNKNTNKFNYYNLNKCNNNDEFIKKNIYIPPININSETLLNVYNLNNIEDIVKYIDNHLNDKNDNFYHIIRILKCWIRINLNNLNIYINVIQKICIKMFYVYFNIDEDEDIEKDINDFIKYWIKKNNNNNIFDLDLFIDIVKYYKKKYIN